MIGSDPVTMDVADDNQDAALGGVGLAKCEGYSEEASCRIRKFKYVI